uniref:Putative secreted protein n=1 Tax=Anopheles darlingi TaxID=43151 RepID=A0A2M4D7X1_ANODA
MHVCVFLYVCVFVCVWDHVLHSGALPAVEELRFRQEECRGPILVVVAEVLLDVCLDRVEKVLRYALVLVILVNVHLMAEDDALVDK